MSLNTPTPCMWYVMWHLITSVPSSFSPWDSSSSLILKLKHRSIWPWNPSFWKLVTSYLEDVQDPSSTTKQNNCWCTAHISKVSMTFIYTMYLYFPKKSSYWVFPSFPQKKTFSRLSQLFQKTIHTSIPTFQQIFSHPKIDTPDFTKPSVLPSPAPAPKTEVAAELTLPPRRPGFPIGSGAELERRKAQIFSQVKMGKITTNDIPTWTWTNKNSLSRGLLVGGGFFVWFLVSIWRIPRFLFFECHSCV